MITDFPQFGLIHIFSLLIPILIGLIFIYTSKKYKDKIKLINIIFVITLIFIRGIRYIFNIYYGYFEWFDLFSFNISHINLILIIICLIKPNKNLWIFTFLIGIPASLLVAFLPGQIFEPPGLIRAAFFIASHMMMPMGTIYLLINNNFNITRKNRNYCFLLLLGILLSLYLLNLLVKQNFLFLMEPKEGTALVPVYDLIGHIPYIILIYISGVILITLMYYLYQVIAKYLLKKGDN